MLNTTAALLLLHLYVPDKLLFAQIFFMGRKMAWQVELAFSNSVVLIKLLYELPL